MRGELGEGLAAGPADSDQQRVAPRLLDDARDATHVLNGEPAKTRVHVSNPACALSIGFLALFQDKQIHVHCCHRQHKLFVSSCSNNKACGNLAARNLWEFAPKQGEFKLLSQTNFPPEHKEEKASCTAQRGKPRRAELARARRLT